jgi:hypothetical protein
MSNVLVKIFCTHCGQAPLLHLQDVSSAIEIQTLSRGLHPCPSGEIQTQYADIVPDAYIEYLEWRNQFHADHYLPDNPFYSWHDYNSLPIEARGGTYTRWLYDESGWVVEEEQTWRVAKPFFTERERMVEVKPFVDVLRARKQMERNKRLEDQAARDFFVFIEPKHYTIKQLQELARRRGFVPQFNTIGNYALIHTNCEIILNIYSMRKEQ